MKKTVNAQSYATDGLKIFPCNPNGKNPLTTNGFKDASNDPEIIKLWWDQYPEANIGLVTGVENNLLVIDVDNKKGVDGSASLRELEAEFGSFDTYAVKTQRVEGGTHYYFTCSSERVKNQVDFRPGIDIRCNGGYVIAAGSSIDGREYTVVDAGKKQAEAPTELVEAILSHRKPVHNLDSLSSSPFGIPEGARNETLFKQASSMRGRDILYEVAENQIIQTARACNPPLEESEAIQVVQSAYQRYFPNTHNTDLGNAQKLTNQWGECIRYITEFKKWIFWGTTRWCFDENGFVIRLAKKTVREMYQQASQVEDVDRRRNMARHAQKSESLHSLEAMEKLARTEEGMPISQSALDTNPYLLGVRNGVVDLRTNTLIINNPEDFITKQAQVDYRPDAPAPRWLSFLDQIMEGDASMVEYLQRIVGYSLTGETSEQVLFFLYGFGANGKSTFVTTIQQMLGDYAAQTPSRTLMTRGRGANNDVARLRGARFVATTETEEGNRFDESELKILTGGDMIAARFLYQEHFEFQPDFKIWISGNHKPFIRGNDIGIWRRIRLIPFDVTIPVAEQDRELTIKLKEELSGILNWAIEGCLKWQEEGGLITPKKVEEATSEYRTELDLIRRWIEECCEKKPHVQTSSSELYQSYKRWATDNGEWVMSHKVFGNKLKEHWYESKRTNKGTVYQRLGLRLPYWMGSSNN